MLGDFSSATNRILNASSGDEFIITHLHALRAIFAFHALACMHVSPVIVLEHVQRYRINKKSWFYLLQALKDKNVYVLCMI